MNALTLMVYSKLGLLIRDLQNKTMSMYGLKNYVRGLFRYSLQFAYPSKLLSVLHSF